LWTDDDNRDLVVSHYPWFLHVYDNLLLQPVMRADAVRAWVCVCGGGADWGW